MNDQLAAALKQHGSVRIARSRLRGKRNLSPKDEEGHAYVGVRELDATCLRKRGERTWVMCDESWTL